MAGTYWLSAGRSLLRHSREKSFLRDLANAGLRADLSPKARTTFVLDLWPQADGFPVELGTVGYRRSNLDPMEQYVLAFLAASRKPKTIFEIGTYDGASTRLLARNAPGAQVYTLDLPPAAASAATVVLEAANASDGVGAKFQGTPEVSRITQLLGDSRTFDFSQWYGGIDLVLVDAGHEYVCAKPDTENALKLAAPGGVVVWDDYVTGWPGVVRAVDESGPARAGQIYHLASTGFAVYEKPA